MSTNSRKRFKIGIIGVGNRGTGLANILNSTRRADVVGGYDSSPETAAYFCKWRGIDVPLRPRMEDILEDPSIDALVISTPDHLHREHALRAMESGKPVLCEKPMAINIPDCDAMLLKQRELGVSFQIGFNLRFNPLFHRMREIAESGDLGDIRAVWVRHFVGRGGNYYFQDWHARRSRSNSLLLQKATHDLDIIHHITGRYTRRVLGLGHRSYFGGDASNDLKCQDCAKQDSCPESAFYFEGEPLRSLCAFREEIDMEDNEAILMDIEGQILASYNQCQFTPDYHRSFTFIGTKGRMECFEPQARSDGWQKDRRIEILLRREKRRLTENFSVDMSGHAGADPAMISSWLDDLEVNRYDESNPIAGRQSVAVGCLAAESIRGSNDWKLIPPLPYNSAPFSSPSSKPEAILAS